jgi:hypothetical protein
MDYQSGARVFAVLCNSLQMVEKGSYGFLLVCPVGSRSFSPPRSLAAFLKMLWRTRISGTAVLELLQWTWYFTNFWRLLAFPSGMYSEAIIPPDMGYVKLLSEAVSSISGLHLVHSNRRGRCSEKCVESLPTTITVTEEFSNSFAWSRLSLLREFTSSRNPSV